MDKQWILIETYLVQETSNEKPPQITLLSDREFADYMKGDWVNRNLKVEIYHLGKKVVG